jgi:predicted nicotinamide N-methyase
VVNQDPRSKRIGKGQHGGRIARSRRRARPDPLAFVRENTRLLPVPSLPEIRLHTAHEATGLWRLADVDEGGDPPAPYWAFPWAGGMALARHLLDHPKTVAGLRILDLGSGSGLVAIAAMKAGARGATAVEIDPYAIAAIALNAAANDVAVTVQGDDITGGPAPAVDLVAVGDLFYERDLADRVTAFLDRCLAAGVAVLIGDPWRAYLPHGRVQLIAEYSVPDVGEVENAATKLSGVFALGPATPDQSRRESVTGNRAQLPT